MSALIQDLSRMAGQGWQWWTGELLSLLPAGLKRQHGQAAPHLVVAVGQAGDVELIVTKSRALKTLSTGQGVWDHLARLGVAKPGSAIALRLPQSSCYRRTVALPANAKHQAQSILALDLERATPFKPGDVYTAHYLEPSADRKGWFDAHQVIVKRSVLDKWVRDVEALGLRAASAGCWDEETRSALPIDFLAGSVAEAGRRGERRGRLLLPLLAAALALSAAAITFTRYQSARDTLDAEVAKARSSAKTARQTRNDMEEAAGQALAVREFRTSRPATVDVIDELTRLLPDSVYLTTLKIEGDAIDIAGLAKSAAEVVPILERSAMFKDAAPTSPVTFDAAEAKERFGLHVKFRNAPEAGHVKPSPESGEASP